jgi:hypothetical protein
MTCFACHSTGPLSLGKDDDIVPHEPGVRCEVCHGPGEAHVRDPAHNALRTPAQLSAAAMNRFCGQCHVKDAANGEPLSDFSITAIGPINGAAKLPPNRIVITSHKAGSTSQQMTIDPDTGNRISAVEIAKASDPHAVTGDDGKYILANVPGPGALSRSTCEVAHTGEENWRAVARGFIRL